MKKTKAKKRYESAARGAKKRGAMMKRFSGFVNVRGAGTNQPRHYGAMADKVYFGARGHCKCGIVHFST